jgi:Mn-dependent DtxR family transcriptional regulator
MDLRLTPSQENYLEHIWHLSSQGSVRVADLADSVGVKRPSVTRAVNNLVSLGLVKHEHYGGIEFTPRGHQAAKFISRRDLCLKRFLVQVLQMDSAKADDEACRMEHAVSAEVIHRLDVLVGYFTDRVDLHKEFGQLLATKRRLPSKRSKRSVRLRAKPHV